MVTSDGMRSQGTKQAYPFSLLDIRKKTFIIPSILCMHRRPSLPMTASGSRWCANSNSAAQSPVAMAVETKVPEMGSFHWGSFTLSPRIAKFNVEGLGGGLKFEIIPLPSVAKIQNTLRSLAG